MNSYQKFDFRMLIIWFICILQASVIVNAVDTRSWDEAVQLFTSSSPSLDIEYVGRKLKEVDEKKAAAYLIPLLATNQTAQLRKRAITAISGGAIKAAVPELIAIALDTNEAVDVRYAALNPGLRYMGDDRAVKTAKQLLHDPNGLIRIGSYCVLSGNPSDESVEALKNSLATCEPDHRYHLIWALCHTGRPETARIVFENCPLDWIANDDVARAYCGIMTRYAFSRAQENILKLIPRNDGSVLYEALAYFEHFPRSEAAKYLMTYLGDEKRVLFGRLQTYPLLWSFYSSPKISAEIKAKLEPHILKSNPELEYLKINAPQKVIVERTVEALNIYEAVFLHLIRDSASRAQSHPFFLTVEGKDPSPDFLRRFRDKGMNVNPSSMFALSGFYCHVDNCRWIDDNQVIVSGGHSNRSNLYLVIRKDGKWIVAKDELLWILDQLSVSPAPEYVQFGWGNTSVLALSCVLPVCGLSGRIAAG